jgi:hypothetical protein
MIVGMLVPVTTRAFIQLLPTPVRRILGESEELYGDRQPEKSEEDSHFVSDAKILEKGQNAAFSIFPGSSSSVDEQDDVSKVLPQILIEGINPDDVPTLQRTETLPSPVDGESTSTQQVSANEGNETVTPVVEKVVELVELPSLENLEKAKQLKEIQAKADALLKEQAKRDAEIRALNETVGTQKEMIAAREKVLNFHQVRLDELNGKIELHKEELKEKDERIQVTEQLISDIEKELEIETDPQRLEDLKSRQRQLQSKLKQQIQERDELKAKLEKEEKAYQAEMAKYQSDKAELARLKSELEKSEAELQKLKATVDSANEEIQQELKSLTIQNKALKGELTPFRVDVIKDDEFVTKVSVFDVDGIEFTTRDREKLKTASDFFAQFPTEVRDQINPFISTNPDIKAALMNAISVLNNLGSDYSQQETEDLSELTAFLQGWLSSLNRTDKTALSQDVSAVQKILDIWTFINSIKGLNSATLSGGESYMEGLNDLKIAIFQWQSSSNLTFDSLFSLLTPPEAFRLQQILLTCIQEGERIKQQKVYNDLHQQIMGKINAFSHFKALFLRETLSLDQLKELVPLVELNAVMFDMEKWSANEPNLNLEQIIARAKEQFRSQKEFFDAKNSDDKVRGLYSKEPYNIPTYNVMKILKLPIDKLPDNFIKTSYASSLFQEIKDKFVNSLDSTSSNVNLTEYKTGIFKFKEALYEEYRQQLSHNDAPSIAFSNKTDVNSLINALENAASYVLLQNERKILTLNSARTDTSNAAGANENEVENIFRKLSDSYSNPRNAIKEATANLSVDEFNQLNAEAKKADSNTAVTLSRGANLHTQELLKFHGRISEDSEYLEFLFRIGMPKSKIRTTEEDVYRFLSYKAWKTRIANARLAASGMSVDEIAAKVDAETKYVLVKNLLPDGITSTTPLPNYLNEGTAIAIYRYIKTGSDRRFFQDVLQGTRAPINLNWRILVQYFDYLIQLSQDTDRGNVLPSGRVVISFQGRDIIIPQEEEDLANKYNKLISDPDFRSIMQNLPMGWNSLARKGIARIIVANSMNATGKVYMKADGVTPIDDAGEVTTDMIADFLTFQKNKVFMNKIKDAYETAKRNGRLVNAYNENNVLNDLAMLANADAGFTVLNLIIDPNDPESVMQYLNFLNGALVVAPPPPPPGQT